MPLTHKEYVDLSFPVLIARLLLRNKHLVALRICDIYNSHSNKEHQNENECYFDHFRGIITMDWAMKKVNPQAMVERRFGSRTCPPNSLPRWCSQT